ncbi:putative copper-importing P-type ATPase A [Trueperella bernardiae]|uniref:Cation-transporting P-type ATPase B n=1 Tax=Trueperella bernardiae TaxID=59561 RepID=A0A0W1KIT4_9ACTO|nr:heavy metal translocating P-type ATPase [Trueperella bernardiae]KTF03533.1 putative copper-importing P-type ATPase A [Trueperella bernardiae]
MIEVDLAVRGMTCASCVARVEKKLNKVPGVTAVVNLATERAHIELDDSAAELSNEELVGTVVKAGYDASVISRTGDAPDADMIQAAEAAAEASAQARVADLWRRFVVSAVLSVPVVGLSMVPALQFPGWQWVIGAVSLVVAFWCGWPFHRAAFRAARYGSSTMDTLVSLGVLASMGWSLWALTLGGAGRIGYTMHMTGVHGLGHAAEPHLYFETSAMIVTFLLIGRWLEARSRRSAGDALRSLLELGASEALLVRRAGSDDTVEQVVPVAQLRVGDVFRVRPGQTVATDGVIVAGSSSIDASLVTGESLPVDVGEGDEVTGATLNTHGSIEVRATRVGKDTTLAQMGRLLAEAQTGKAPVQRIADQISAVFVPVVILIALATFGVRMFTDNAEMALASAITVLVVACPCALGLATPTALLVGSGRLSRLGALIRGPEVLEGAHAVDTIMLDKTGTLTSGVMSVSEVEAAAGAGFGRIGTGADAADAESAASGADSGTAGTRAADAVLALAAGLESHSEHPIAQAIVRSARERGITPAPVSDFANHAGMGVAGTAGGERVAAGRLTWLAANVPSDLAERAEDLAREGASVVVVTRGNTALGLIAVRDTVRPEAADTLAALRDRGLTPVLVTGDNAPAATTVAAELGIEDVRADVLPEQKLEVLKELQATGKKVAMVGDGVNDAAALAGADLSIAMGSGTDVAKAAADITIVNSDIRAIPNSLRVSARTLQIIKENLAWAFAYNLIAIPLAVFGVIVPGIAAFAMASSSVIVVGNSLRLRNA